MAHGKWLVPGNEQRRRGVTILELLVVVLILMMVTAAAVPLVAPAMHNRQMRESSRLVSSFLQSARARAVETGRPCGVKIERFDGNPFAFVLSQVEVPPPYAGDDVDSRFRIVGVPVAMVASVVSSSAQTASAAVYSEQQPAPAVRWFQAFIAGGFNAALVRVGDQVRLGGKGPLFTIWGPDADGDGVVDPNPPSIDLAYVYAAGTAEPAFIWDNASAATGPQLTEYQIFRQPVRTATAPLQLPEAVVVDLIGSGIGERTWSTLTSSGWECGFDAVIMFQSTGRLGQVSREPHGHMSLASDNVYLLVGRRDLMPDATGKNVDLNLSAEASAVNILMPPPENFIVSIGWQTGLVSVSELAPNTQHVSLDFKRTLAQARRIARTGQGVGGR